MIATASETQALAMSVADTGGVTFVPAFVGLGTPHWEAEARGTITGITRGTTRAHLVRAAVESIAYGTADLLRTVMDSSALDVPVLRVDGGAAANDFLMQFQADLLGVPVERPAMLETTALGAAGLAGIATGVWSSVDELRGSDAVRRFEPAISDGRAGERAWPPGSAPCTPRSPGPATAPEPAGAAGPAPAMTYRAHELHPVPARHAGTGLLLLRRVRGAWVRRRRLRRSRRGGPGGARHRASTGHWP